MKTNLMKKLTATALAMGMLAGCGQSDGANTGNTDGTGRHFTVGVAQLVDHTSLNTIRDAMFD